MKFIRPFVYAFFLFVISCTTIKTGIPGGEPSNRLLVWAFSDIQPRNIAERSFFEMGAKDVRENYPPIDIAIIAGDIVQVGSVDRSSEDYEWFFSVRKTVNVGSWFEVAGNHDARNMPNYLKNIGKPLHYAVE
ncbi:MAG TPA: metallophosphoesterase, partial [Spirochaetota bacterium]